MADRSIRIEIRLSEEQKELLEQAAAIKGQDLTSFALGVLLEEAYGVLKERETRTLTLRDRRAFFKLLQKPPAPNAALRAAVRELRTFRGR
jgi:uncharacterized protein (DUF1778 family)